MSKIYLIECVRDYDTVYKIGYTKSNSNKRAEQLQTGNDGQIRVIREFNTINGMSVERSLHRLFSHKNINKEWFKLDLNDVQNFIPLCETIENNLNVLKESSENIF